MPAQKILEHISFIMNEYWSNIDHQLSPDEVLNKIRAAICAEKDIICRK